MVSSMAALDAGSSPLARGLLITASTRRARLRIIPARAGFTRGHTPKRRPSSDHPRSRGVYLDCWRTRPSIWGSSPLARGLHDISALKMVVPRIIPARAGFTSIQNTSLLWYSDHPRSRGVYSSSSPRAARTAGSSPLARGLLRLVLDARQPRRIIPARAGFTSRPTPLWKPCVDHPRSRGVYPLPYRPALGRPGSSPLARGLPASVPACARPPGIIPARAGFTGRRPR